MSVELHLEPCRRKRFSQNTDVQDKSIWQPQLSLQPCGVLSCKDRQLFQYLLFPAKLAGLQNRSCGLPDHPMNGVLPKTCEQCYNHSWGSPAGSVIKNLPTDAGDRRYKSHEFEPTGWEDPWKMTAPPVCLLKSMDRGAWQRSFWTMGS